MCITEGLWITFRHAVYTCYLYHRGSLSYIWVTLVIPAICITEELWVTFSHVIYTCYLDQRENLSYICSCYLYLLSVSKLNFELHLVMIFVPAIWITEELFWVTFSHVIYTCYLYHRGTSSYMWSCYLYLVPTICITEELRVTFVHVIYTCYLYQSGTLSYI